MKNISNDRTVLRAAICKAVINVILLILMIIFIDPNSFFVMVRESIPFSISLPYNSAPGVPLLVISTALPFIGLLADSVLTCLWLFKEQGIKLHLLLNFIPGYFYYKLCSCAIFGHLRYAVFLVLPLGLLLWFFSFFPLFAVKLRLEKKNEPLPDTEKKDGFYYLKRSSANNTVALSIILISLCFVIMGCRFLLTKPRMIVDVNASDVHGPVISHLWQDTVLTPPKGAADITVPFILEKEEIKKIKATSETAALVAEIFRQFCPPGKEMYSYYRLDRETIFNTSSLSIQEFISENKNSEDPPVLLFYSENKLLKEEDYDIIPVSSSALVFITHKDNPVTDLSIVQLKDIYTGDIENWKDVGGNDSLILAFQSSESPYCDEEMKASLMGDAPFCLSPLGYGSYYPRPLAKSLIQNPCYINTPSSIGYTFSFNLKTEYSNMKDLKVLSVNGWYPSEENILNQYYRFETKYYAAIRKDEPTDSIYRKLVDFLISTDEGHELMRNVGYYTNGDK